MAGSKTRFGFAGEGSEPPDGDEARSARTVFGHDIHLKLPADSPPPRIPGLPTPVPPRPVSNARVAAPAQAWVEPVPGAPTRQPRPSGLARFLGRWTRSGRFISRSRMGNGIDEDANLPRDTTGRNVLLVLLVALVAFLLTFAVVRIRQHLSSTGPEVREQPQAAPAPASQIARQQLAPVAPVVLPPQVPPAQTPTRTPPATNSPSATSPRGLGTVESRTNPRPHKPTPRSPGGSQPPAHLKGEILPLAL